MRSAFDLPAGARVAIQEAVRAGLSAGIPIRFETAPDLISGVVLSANGIVPQQITIALRGSYHRGHQTRIDAEPFDVIVGFELLMRP